MLLLCTYIFRLVLLLIHHEWVHDGDGLLVFFLIKHQWRSSNGFGFWTLGVACVFSILFFHSVMTYLDPDQWQFGKKNLLPYCVLFQSRLNMQCSSICIFWSVENGNFAFSIRIYVSVICELLGCVDSTPF